ncbi:MAG: hypothetical protein ACRC7O_03350 [Fimbriiglobus sp.]
MSLPDAQTAFLASAVRFIVPEVVLLATACALFLLAVFLPRRPFALAVGMLGVASAVVATLDYGVEESTLFA